MSFAASQWYAPVVQDHTLVPADVPNFPLLITAANAPPGMLDTLAVAPQLVATPAKAGGGDLLVYLQEPAPGVEPATRYAIEVVSLALAAGPGGTCQIWVGVPNLSSSVDTTVYLVWGDAAASQPARADLYGSESVWASDLTGVYHFEEDPSGSAPQLNDSTSNAHHGTSAGGMTSGDLVPGVIGNAWDFDGDDLAALPAAAMPLGPGTLSIWLTPDADQPEIVWSSSVGGAANREFFVALGNVSGLTDELITIIQFASAAATPLYIVGYTAADRSELYDGQPHNIRLCFSGSTSLPIIMLDGVQKTTTVLDPSTAYTMGVSGADNARIASLLRPAGETVPYAGIADEARIRDVASSVSSMAAHYLNESDPGSFASAGAVQSLAAATARRASLFFWDQA